MFPNGYFGTYFLDDFFPPEGEDAAVVVPVPEPIVPPQTVTGGEWVGRYRRAWRYPTDKDEARARRRLRRKRRRAEEELLVEILGRLP